MSKNTAVAVAKRRAAREPDSELITLSTGVVARFIPVSVSIITEAQAALPEPPVPTWFNESKGVEEPNPSDPGYIKALENLESDRNLAAIDAMIMFGVELVDGPPENDRWLKNLLLRDKLGLSNVDLSTFDLENDIEIEFLYKKYIAVAAADIAGLMKLSGVSEEDIAEAARTFRDNEE